MVKTVTTPIEGFENLYAELSEMQDKHEANKQAEIDRAVAAVEERYAEMSARIEKLKSEISVTEEIEVEEPLEAENGSESANVSEEANSASAYTSEPHIIEEEEI